MKRSAPREIAFLCAPVALIGVGVLVARVLHPPHPDPTLRLFVGPIQNSASSLNGRQRSDFGWGGRITDAEEKPRKVGYRASLFGRRPGQARVLLYSSSTPVPTNGSSAVPAIQTGGAPVIASPPIYRYWDGQKVSVGTSFALAQIPPGVQELEWQLEVVAAPLRSSTPSFVYQRDVSPETLQEWARIPGALYAQKRMTTKLRGAELDPILDCSTDNQLSSSFRGKIEVMTHYKGDSSRLFRRLEAFDGKTHRLLWQDVAIDSGLYTALRRPYIVEEKRGGSTVSSSGMTWKTNWNGLGLDLRSVPASWGRITLQVEVVADPKSGPTTPPMAQNCDQSTLQQLKAQGWVYGKRTVVLRDETAKKSARQKITNQIRALS